MYRAPLSGSRCFRPQIEVFSHPTSPSAALLSASFKNTTMWGPQEEKKGSDSSAFLEPVVCQNSLSFAPQKHCQPITRACGIAMPMGTCEWITVLLKPTLKPFSHPTAPKIARLSAPFKTQQCGAHNKRGGGRIVERFWGLWRAKIPQILAPKALSPGGRCLGH